MADKKSNNYDIIIIGAGVVGCTVARELSRYKVSVAVVEKESDVSLGTSGKNSGVIHSGITMKAGSVKARLCVQGNKMFDKLSKELDFPFKRIGTLIVARNKEEVRELDVIKKEAELAGVKGLKLIGKDELKRIEPNVAGLKAVYAPSGGITSPMLLTIALAENASMNGVKFFLDTEVTGITKGRQGFMVKCKNRKALNASVVINSAGLYSDRIASMVSIKKHRIYPCRGEYHVLDKAAAGIVNSMIYPVPEKISGGKGIHVTPTVDGNILLGPSSEYIEQKEDAGTTADVMKKLFMEARKLVPAVDEKLVIANYAGLRSKIVSPGSKTSSGDFIIEESKMPGFINLIGIESPGLAASPAIALKAVDIVKNVFERNNKPLRKNKKFQPHRKGIPDFEKLSEKEKDRLIKKEPDYGVIVCRCEQVTKKQVTDAINNSLGVKTVEGIRYRCRAGMGRCQAGFCMQRVVELIRQDTGKKPEEITLRGKGSKLFAGRVK